MENINLTSLSRGNQWNGSALGERENRDRVEWVYCKCNRSFHVFISWARFDFYGMDRLRSGDTLKSIGITGFALLQSHLNLKSLAATTFAA